MVLVFIVICLFAATLTVLMLCVYCGLFDWWVVSLGVVAV